MDNRNVSILGMRSGIGEGFKVEPVPFGIEQDDRLRHFYIVGKTGTGKSTLLQNLILQDIEEGQGFALLEYPGTTLLGVTRMLQDKDYRAAVLRHVTNPIVRSYWLEEFPRYGKEFAATASSRRRPRRGRCLAFHRPLFIE